MTRTHFITIAASLFLTLGLWQGCSTGQQAANAPAKSAVAARSPAPEARRVRGAVHSIKLPEVEPDLPDLPGRNTVLTNCGVCHNPHYIMTQPNFSRETWTAEVTKMRKNYSAPVPEENVAEIIDYLVLAKGTGK